jgi:SOS-response transcriptional repressor LexA
MKTIADRVRALREARKWDQSELARQVSVIAKRRISPQSIQQLEAGEISRPRYLPELAKSLTTTIEYLLTGKEPQGNIIAGPEVIGSVPLISWVQAGQWCNVVDVRYPGEGEKRVFTTKKVGKRAYALRVQGDSMENPAGKPTYPDGSIIIIDPDKQAENGSRVVALMDDEPMATFKVLVFDGGRRYLKPLNPRYPIMEVTTSATICGVVVQTIIDED